MLDQAYELEGKFFFLCCAAILQTSNQACDSVTLVYTSVKLSVFCIDCFYNYGVVRVQRKRLATDKPRLAITLSEEIYEAVLDYCDKYDLSKSDAIESFLGTYFSLPDKEREKFEELAEYECRTITQQIQFTIRRSID